MAIKKEMAKEIKKSKNEMKKYVAKTNLARLKKIDELDKKKKEKTTTKGKTSESSSTRKKSRSKSKEPSRNLSSKALKERGLVTPKKKKEHRQSTPPTVDSTSTTSSMRNLFTKRLNMSNMSPQKKQRRVDTDKLQAHQVEWTTNEGCARAIRHNEQDLTKEEVKDMSYSAKLHTLLKMYQPKQLMSAYPGICIAKGINVKNIDMNAAFLNSAKARKTISEACNDVVEINSEASSTSDQDR